MICTFPVIAHASKGDEEHNEFTIRHHPWSSTVQRLQTVSSDHSLHTAGSSFHRVLGEKSRASKDQDADGLSPPLAAGAPLPASFVIEG